MLNKPSLLEALEERRAGFGLQESEDLLHASLQMPKPLDMTEDEEEESWRDKVLGFLDLIERETKQLMTKGEPATAWKRFQQVNIISESLDWRGFNAAYVEIDVSGANPSATIEILGGSYENGNFQLLPDKNALQTNVTGAKAFIVGVGAPWIRVQIAAISGTFGDGLGFQVTVTPFKMAGAANAALGDDHATGTAAINLTSAVTKSNLKLKNVTIHFNTAPTTAGTLSVTLQAVDGSAYNTVLYSKDPSVGSLTDIVYDANDLAIKAGDTINVSYANADGRTYGVRIITEAM